MRIHQPTVAVRQGTATYSALIEAEGMPGELWFRTDAKYADMMSDHADAATVALVLPAMLRKENIAVEGRISPATWQSLIGPYQHVQQSVLGIDDSVDISCREIYEANYNGKATITGFSAGVDSFSVLLSHFLGENPRQPKVSHLLFNNVGSHGVGRHWLFEQRFEHLGPIAKEMNLPFVPMDSNLMDFYVDELTFKKTYSTRNAAAALVLQKGACDYLHASSLHYHYVHTAPVESAGPAEPFVMRVLSNQNIRMQTVGCEMTRSQKIHQISTDPIALQNLNVCASGDSATNCSKCWKCMRTMLAMEALGVLEKFAGSFDIEKFWANRTRYLATILSPTSQDEAELISMARQGLITIPVASRLQHIADPLLTVVARLRDRLLK